MDKKPACEIMKVVCVARMLCVSRITRRPTNFTASNVHAYSVPTH